MKMFASRTMRGVAIVGVIAAIAGAAFYFHETRNRHHLGKSASNHEYTKGVADNLAKVQRSGADELTLPETVIKRMGLTVAPVQTPTHAINLPGFQGVLALDNDRLSRVHARFGGEVVELGHSTDGSDPTLRVGEKVRRGDLLAVIWSTELGQKKSELVDALTKLKAEEQLRDRLKTLFKEGAGAGRSYRDAEKDVQSRLVEIASLDRSLRTWRVTDEDIAEIHAEATRVAKADELVETAMPSAEANDWAKVEVRAPMSGVILEKNVVVGDIVGTDTDLFKIGDLSQLAVWAHVYEEDLPLLESLPHPILWTVSLPSRQGTFPGMLEKVGAVIDPTQHTALVTGRVKNQSELLKIGQSVTVTVQLPPPEHELELPVTAVVEDGRQSVVFVQPASGELHFVRRPVHVVRRFRNTIYVRAAESGLQPGELIVTAGALMLQNAIDQLPDPTASTKTIAGSPTSPSSDSRGPG